MVFRLRMQRAEELLVKYDYALKNIAEELGYGTPFAFSNAFKRHKGISPEHFRRQRV
jgi:AraC-like DNA-binding protein